MAQKLQFFVAGLGRFGKSVAVTLEKMGYTRAHNLSGGIAAWRVAGLPLKKGSKK